MEENLNFKEKEEEENFPIGNKFGFIKLLKGKKNCFLLNEDIFLEEKSTLLKGIYIQDEDEEKDFPDFEDNITTENILYFDFKKYLEPNLLKKDDND